MSGRRRVALCLGVAAVVLLGGCADDAQPPSAVPSETTQPSTSDAASPTQSATSTLTAPTLPPEATQETPEGAAAFVRYWFNLVNHAYLTGSLEELRKASHPECSTCGNVIAQIEKRYTAGGSIVGGDILVVSTQASPIDDIGVSLVSTIYEQSPLVELNSDLSTATAGPGEKGAVAAFYAQFRGGQWRAFEVTRG